MHAYAIHRNDADQDRDPEKIEGATREELLERLAVIEDLAGVGADDRELADWLCQHLSIFADPAKPFHVMLDIAG